MVTLGTDSHKRSHTLVAVDENGRQLGELRVAATPEGHVDALTWARRWPDRRWAMENCRQVSRRLERDLLRAGERVLQVSPKLMVASRRSTREPGKSDPIDALATARAALREPNLPVAQLEGKSRELKVLVDHREDLVQQRTQIQNRLLWNLHDLEPGLRIPSRGLLRTVVLADIRRRAHGRPGAVAEVVREQVDWMEALNRSIKALEGRIEGLTAEMAPNLLELRGCGSLTAAKLVAETADVLRFHSSGAFARHNGTAPIPVWSGNQQRHRLNRGGNRQLNVALHRIAITQLRLGGEARVYVEKRMSIGNSRTEAIRLLRRQLSDEVYRRLRLDALDGTSVAAATAA